MDADKSSLLGFINYYRVGGSLPHYIPSYVKRQADEELYQGLKNGDFCCVFNSRQMGKSSLRVKTRQKLEQEGIRCTSIDMTTVGSSESTAEKFYAGITYELWSGFFNDVSGFFPWWESQKVLPPLQRLSQFIEKELLEKFSEKVVIFIDEIDNLMNREVKDEFLGFIRACYDHRADKQQYKRVTFCLLGVVTPSDLKDRTGVPFNIGRTIELTGFNFQEAEKSLTPGLAEKVDAPESVLAEILDWTGGQPFLTQKLCKLIVEKSENRQPNIENLVRSYIIENWEFYDEPEHLRTIKNRLLLIDSKVVYRRLEIYRQILQKYQIVADDHPDQIALRLSGLVVKHQGKLKVCNYIYESIFNLDWIEKNLNLIDYQSKSLDISDELSSKFVLNYTLLVPVATFLAVIGLVSLGFSYIFVDSKPWNDIYNKNNMGVIVDCIRICFLLMLEVYIMGSAFNQDLIQLIQSKKFYLRRRITYLMGSLFILILLFHHLWYGPHQLLGNNHVSSDEYFKQYLLPYIFYFPYSFINFIIVGIPLSISSIHVAIEDCNDLGIKLEQYKNDLAEIKNKIEKSSFGESNVNNQLLEKLKKLHSGFYEKIKRSINLLLGILVLIYFDATMGRTTLSNGGYILTQLFCIFGLVIPVITLTLWGLLAYQQNVEKTIEVLFISNYDFNQVERKYSTFKLVQRILTSNLFFRIICLLYSFHIIHLIYSSTLVH